LAKDLRREYLATLGPNELDDDFDVLGGFVSYVMDWLAKRRRLRLAVLRRALALASRALAARDRRRPAPRGAEPTEVPLQPLEERLPVFACAP
jgi:hypothetical protein